jgi:hypothetical protein
LLRKRQLPFVGTEPDGVQAVWPEMFCKNDQDIPKNHHIEPYSNNFLLKGVQGKIA